MDETEKVKQDFELRKMLKQSMNLTASGKLFCRTLVEWIENGTWKRHWDARNERWVECETFKEFMEASPAKGLGLCLENIGQDLELLQRGGLDEATRVLAAWKADEPLSNQPRGRPFKAESNKSCNTTIIDRGTVDYTLRRLARDAPKLLESIKRGELSVNQAAIRAGIRKKPTPLQELLRAWKKATKEERTEFMKRKDDQ
jgi:hypothetical protein